MHHFRVGDQITVRSGNHRGEKGQVVESQPAEVYKVRLEDGSALFFSEAGIQEDPKKAQDSLKPAR